MLGTLMAVGVIALQLPGGSGGGFWRMANEVSSPTPSDDWFGTAVDAGGDLIGNDGIRDLVVSAFDLSPSSPTPPHEGKVYVYSGADLALGASSYPPAVTFPMRPFGLLHPEYTWAPQELQLVDLTGDGKSELLCGGFSDAPKAFSSLVYAFYPDDSVKFYKYWGAAPAAHAPLGLPSYSDGTMHAIGDLNGDDRPEVLNFRVGQYSSGYNSPTENGAFAILDGATGTPLFQLQGISGDEIIQAGAAGDLDGDGNADFFLLRGYGTSSPRRLELWTYDGTTFQARMTITDLALQAALSAQYFAYIRQCVAWQFSDGSPFPANEGNLALLIEDSNFSPKNTIARVRVDPTYSSWWLDKVMALDPVLGIEHVGDVDSDGYGDFLGNPPGALTYSGLLFSLQREELLDYLPGNAKFGTTANEFAGRGKCRSMGDLRADPSPLVEPLTEFAVSGAVGGSYLDKVFMFHFQPALTVKNASGQSLTSISSTQATQANLDMDFRGRFHDNSGSDYSYQILVSLSGVGPTIVDGVKIPLAQDQYFNDSLAGVPPFNTLNGPLNISALHLDRAITIPAMPNQSGNTLRIAVVLRKTNTGTPIVVSSMAWPIGIQ